MSGKITGAITGVNRKDIQDKVKALASSYFETCVSFRLMNERPAEGGFEAEFEAFVHHNIEYMNYGPNRCRYCKRDSWPHARLEGDRSR